MASMVIFAFLLLFVSVALAFPPNSHKSTSPEERRRRDDLADEVMHSKLPHKGKSYSIKRTWEAFKETEEEKETAHWLNSAQAIVKEHLSWRQNTKIAKNVILFIGDGMSIPTLTAARTYQGQLEGRNEGSLFWEKFSYTGLVKTYCVDSIIADSACSATAYLCGVKSNYGTIGVNAKVPRGDCAGQLDKRNHVTSISQWAQTAGKATGIVTTTRVTHASPAGTFARVANRDWESDFKVVEENQDPRKCIDIATQLVKESPGKDFKVILGGGRREFLPATTVDDEGAAGRRLDGVNLIKAWRQDKVARNATYEYVWNRESLRKVTDDPGKVDYLLGLFESSHCSYYEDAAPSDPTLAEMTEAAIKILQQDSKGYFLFVEGGRIDHAHHDTYANLALSETVELSKAVELARKLTSEEDTLIVVTADHAHTMSISGYPDRGNDILGIAEDSDVDDLPYAVLNYANGPGYKPAGQNGSRYNITNDDLGGIYYQYPSLAPRSSETHGGDDVAVFASGPWSHLFTGTMEQHGIPHLMAYAACMGQGLTACKRGS
ncbi:membrane-bound alkaline phosphatase isoform X2 [Orussus abietinus]|uniref:membrane-bound alkaline phosphatase isoform X2 n=1 Tax=Orussus abietinus TaxID=222816 RepID=UPI0006253F07|nr:membrane-bound alkaline phosphatase isoform X2 [Orussus abietinus]